MIASEADHRRRNDQAVRARRVGIRVVGGLLGVLAALVPFLAVFLAAKIEILALSGFLLLSPWIAFGLPIGAVAGLIVGASLAPSVWNAHHLEWWLAGKVSYMAWLIGLAVAGVLGFVIGSGDIGTRLLLGAFMVMSGLPMLVVAFPAALAWLALMRLATTVMRRIG
jgi:hypothetical protein